MERDPRRNPDKALRVRLKHKDAPTLANKVKDAIRSNNLPRADKAMVKLHQFNRFLRLRDSTDAYSLRTLVETSTTHKERSSRSKAMAAPSSTSSTRTSKRQLLRTLLSDKE
jgi:hypothetical protein